MDKYFRLLLRWLGGGLALIGLVAAFYGPLEIYVFYLFSEGGPFYYDGFGVGSFWFAALVIQILGYYVIAAILLPIGWGHLALRRWALTVTRLVLWFWVGSGVVVVIGAISLLPSVLQLNYPREVLWTRIGISAVAIVGAFILAPVLGLGFYRTARVRSVFAADDHKSYWIEAYPLPLSALVLLMAVIIVVLHLALFFQAVFPVFGSIQMGRPMVYVIALCVVVFGILIYGVLRREPWSWWGSLICVSVLTLSTALSFARYDFWDIIAMMDLPRYEVEFLGRLTALHGLRLAGILVTPLLATLALVVYSRRYFRRAAG